MARDIAAPSEVEEPAGPENEVSFDPRILIPDSIGPVRRRVLEELIDSENPMSVGQFIASMPPGVTRGNVETALLRNLGAGLVERVGAGIYRLAPPKPPEPSKPAAPPPEDEAVWYSALDAWALDPAGWPAELGPPPGAADRRIPWQIEARWADRQRKRQQRARDAQAAAAKRAEADRELRDRLIAATQGGYTNGPSLDDVRPIRAAMELVPLDRILSAIRYQCDRKMLPSNAPAVSWREERLLRQIATDWCRLDVIPNLVKMWSAEGTASLRPANAPNVLPSTPEPAEQETAPAASPAQPGAASDNDLASALMREMQGLLIQIGERGRSPNPASGNLDGANPPDAAAAAPAALPLSRDGRPVVQDREVVLQAFARARVPPQPPAIGSNQHQERSRAATEPPSTLRPPRPAERPWFASAQPPQPRPELTDEAVDELIQGWCAGNLAWPRRLLGEEPGHPDCSLSRETLRRNGLA